VSVALYMFIRFAFLIFLESSIVRRLMCSLSGVFTRATTTRDRSIKMHKRGRRIIGHAEITGETLGGSRSL
jgi:hypothetical protein